MIYGNNFLKEEYQYGNQYITEGLLKDKIGEKINRIIEKFKRPKTPGTSSKKEEEVSLFKVVKGTSADMDKVYNSDGLSFEGYDFSELKDENQVRQMASKFFRGGVILKKNATFYVFSGKDVNKHYDLEGDNAYSDDYSITVISFNDFTFIKGINHATMKSFLDCRYWCDVVDNNEYREYKKGRHKYTKNIQWLIDWYEKL